MVNLLILSHILPKRNKFAIKPEQKHLEFILPKNKFQPQKNTEIAQRTQKEITLRSFE